MPTKSQLIHKYFGAYGAKERKVLDDAFAEDFTFTSPYTTTASARSSISSAAGRTARACGRSGSSACSSRAKKRWSLPDVTLDGDEFRNTEFFRFAGDRVKSIDVYFGASYRDGVFVKGK